MPSAVEKLLLPVFCLGTYMHTTYPSRKIPKRVLIILILILFPSGTHT